MTDTNDAITVNERMLAACENDQDDLLADLLLQDGDIQFKDEAGGSVFHYAAKYGALSCIEFLTPFATPALLNAKDKKGNTPLHYAVQYTEDPFIALAVSDALIDAGADPRIENRDKLAPWQLVPPKNDDLKGLFDQAIAGYEMGDSDAEDEPHRMDSDD
ncbi:uncharacterized protein BYT42DRAFT_543776 [Radiomyces spectabilis]|uniref:uncharacterized protein n=1 Tax=Radiomyces spectabilis TaxID=64574 RepID=UPI00221E44FC|nr:uncharacterized protein BYT42DRAFT_543776 [Radiomyces spectabilis]KAI8388482.1 hypothetical protein BYT42DRAFT_543776 [Radiomyces spectabilis]